MIMHGVNLAAIDLNLLVVLNALLEERSVTRAARRVGLSQPAMSHALGRLRALLADPVLVREGRLMVPTLRAQAMAEPLAAALSALSALVKRPDVFDPSTATRTVRLASTDFAQAMVLPELCGRLQEVAPGVDVVVHPTSDGALGMLARGEVDLVLGPLRLADASTAIHHEKLFDERFVCLARAGHPLTRGRMTVERFAKARHAFIAPRGRRGGAVDDALEKLGFSRRVAFQSAQFLVAPYVVEKTDLVITIPERVARLFASVTGLATFASPLELEGFAVSMIWHERTAHDGALTFIRGEVRRLFGPRGPGRAPAARPARHRRAARLP